MLKKLAALLRLGRRRAPDAPAATPYDVQAEIDALMKGPVASYGEGWGGLR